MTLLLPAACARIERYYDSKLPLDTPIGWWHDLQGGIIAEERPPPPGIADPYPNLAQIPAKPTPTDANTRRELSARLGAERDRATRAAAQEPIGPNPNAAAPAAPPAVAAKSIPPAAAPPPAAALAANTAPAAAPAEPPPMARIEAAEARPLPAAPPPPQAAPAPAAIQAAASPTRPPRRPAVNEPQASGPVPDLPTGAPSLPTIDGIPPATSAPPTPRPRPQVDAAFIAGSALLRPETDAALRQLAARRAGGTIAVLGGGDARSASLDAQEAALPLAWRRVRAMQEVLQAAGVPVAAMRGDAVALARGGVVRLVD